MPEEPQKSVEDAIREDGRYPVDAYAFLNEGLARAVKAAHGKKAEAEGEPAAAPGGPASRHVTGRQLCLSLRDLALERWGLLAPLVLEKWNIRATLDFGNMVYMLIKHGYMKKTDEDSIEDFRGVFDFAKAFDIAEFELKE